MAHEPTNLLLTSLPAEDREFLLARMQPVALPIGTVLHESGERPTFAHFMTTGLTSIVTTMADGTGTEVGLIGREGLPEAVDLIGPIPPPTRAFIQVEGAALRIRFADLEKFLQSSSAFRQRLLQSVQCQTFILGQLTACNGLHEIEERLARWLLMVGDRLESERFYLTQEFLADMLGARRTSVTLAAGSLQHSGIIQYRRGHIQIVDRAALQDVACECYPIARDLLINQYQ
jgi:CRP-like cAMP-binding protein